MQLCYGLVQQDSCCRLSIRDALNSKFSRNYIPEDMNWHETVKESGFVIEPTGEIPTYCVLVWSKMRGYSGIPLFDFLKGEIAGYYAGVLEIKKKSGGKDTAADLSLHSVIWDAVYSLNGTPSSQLKVEQMVLTGAYGSLLESSRIDPTRHKSGNVKSPNHAGTKFRTAI